MIVVDVEKLRIEYFQNDIPVDYKLRCGNIIKICPIKVKQWHMVEDFAILNIPKNETNDIDAIKMSYLQFLNERYFIQFPEEKQKFLDIMCLCFGLEQGRLQFAYEQKKIVLATLDNDEIMTSIITSGEFDELCKIILFQNIVGYDDEYVSKDVREEIQRYLKYHTNKETRSPTLEEKKIYIYAKKNLTIQEINDMSYRLFTQVYDVLFDCEQFLADKIIQASEKYKVEKNIHHPMVDIKQTIYDRVFGSLDEVKGKITQANN